MDEIKDLTDLFREPEPYRSDPWRDFEREDYYDYECEDDEDEEDDD